MGSYYPRGKQRIWGAGAVPVVMLAYAGDRASSCPQIIAFVANAMLRDAMDNAPAETRLGCALYHDGNGDNFVVIGWSGPIFKIEMPFVDRRN